MRRTGMDVIYALNRANDANIDLAPAVAQQYKDDIFLLGILYNWISKSELSTPAGLPVITQVGISSVARGRRAGRCHAGLEWKQSCLYCARRARLEYDAERGQHACDLARIAFRNRARRRLLLPAAKIAY